ncbi:hypothetical protein ACQR1Q_36165 [Bradyrhizobium oligotrophicum]|uniref:hypothetical protein n=1 Tax=Bradyrhizobium oligotrophicum TaxID=44255 RepID=UPI003EBE1D4C
MKKLFRTFYAVALLAPLIGCDGGAPELRVSVREVGQGAVISIINADTRPLEIRDITVNDRDECTHVEPALNSASLSEFWLEGKNLDNNDRRQIWLQSKSLKDALVLSPDGKYSLCNDVCPEGYANKGFSYITGRNACAKGSEYISATSACRKVVVGSFDKIVLNVGDEKNWSANSRCKRVIRVRVVTEKGTGEYSF